MKLRQILCIACVSLLAMPLLSGAEIYKWKDKDGVVRYSDTPPPPNVKQESMGKKTVKPVENVAPAPTQETSAPETIKQPETKQPLDPEAEAARVRQRNAEMEKNNKQERELQAKLKEDNCRAAKANHETYTQGGRVSKMNEKGEREYLGDKDLKEGAEKAQAEINEYCN